jgi:hypothetical protein
MPRPDVAIIALLVAMLVLIAVRSPAPFRTALIAAAALATAAATLAYDWVAPADLAGHLVTQLLAMAAAQVVLDLRRGRRG